MVNKIQLCSDEALEDAVRINESCGYVNGDGDGDGEGSATANGYTDDKGDGSGYDFGEDGDRSGGGYG